MGLRPQALELLLHVGALAADAFQTLLVISELLVEGLGALRSKRRRAKSVADNRQGETSRETVSAVTSLRDASP